MAVNRFGSILTVDFGSVHTRAALFDVVDGVYQLVARGETRTTTGYPLNDVSVGLDRVLREISDTTGRQFLDADGGVITPELPNRNGVDWFITTASAGRPMRAVLVGLSPNLSLASALNAISSVYVQVEAAVHLGDNRNEEERLNAILLARPDVILISGGVDGGARRTVLELAQIVKLAVDLTDVQHQPAVIFAGNNDLHGDITALFGDYEYLYLSPNIRPDMHGEMLEAARLQLSRAFDRFKETFSLDFALVGESSTSGIMPTSQGYVPLVEYLSKVKNGDVLSVDIGSSATIVTAALSGQTLSTIFSDMGIGHSADRLLERVGLEAVQRWLPFYCQPDELTNYAANKTLRPATIPFNLRELYIEHALLRAAISRAVHNAYPRWNGVLPQLAQLIVSGAALSGTGHAGYTALLAIDALQPQGVTELVSDPYALVPLLGALAPHHPHAVVQILESGAIETLGPVVSVSGFPKQDKTAFKVKVEMEGYSLEETVLGGHMKRIELPAGEWAMLEVKASRGLHIGGKRKVRLKVRTGTAGIILDGRGRPLPLSVSLAQLAQLLPMWVHEMTGDPLQEIPESWLQAPQEKATQSRRLRRGKRRRGKDAALDERLSTMEAAAIEEDELPALDEEDLDDEFMALLEEDDGDDLGDLRDVLS